MKREPSGIPTGGQFATQSRDEPNVSLGVVSAPQSWGARASGLPEARPADWGSPFDMGPSGSYDRAIDAVLEGPISRGVVRGESAVQLHAWDERTDGSDDPRVGKFRYGMRRAVIALMHDKDGVTRDEGGYNAASRLLMSKRTSKAGRAAWIDFLRNTSSEEEARGALLVGMIASGTDGWWGVNQETVLD